MRVHFIVNNVVINTVEQDTLDNPWNYFAVADDNAGPGWIWDGSVLHAPIFPTDYREILRNSYKFRLQGKARRLEQKGETFKAAELLIKASEV